MEILKLLFISLVSGFAGSVFTIWWQVRYEIKKRKLENLRKFVANRYDLKGDNFSRAINEIFITYRNSSNVQKEYLDFYNALVNKEASDVLDDMLLKVFRAMCEDLKIDSNDYHKFLKVFNVKKD